MQVCSETALFLLELKHIVVIISTSITMGAVGSPFLIVNC